MRCKFCGRFMKKHAATRYECRSCGASLIYGEWYAKRERLLKPRKQA